MFFKCYNTGDIFITEIPYYMIYIIFFVNNFLGFMQKKPEIGVI